MPIASVADEAIGPKEDEGVAGELAVAPGANERGGGNEIAKLPVASEGEDAGPKEDEGAPGDLATERRRARVRINVAARDPDGDKIYPFEIKPDSKLAKLMKAR